MNLEDGCNQSQGNFRRAFYKLHAKWVPAILYILYQNTVEKWFHKIIKIILEKKFRLFCETRFDFLNLTTL